MSKVALHPSVFRWAERISILLIAVAAGYAVFFFIGVSRHEARPSTVAAALVPDEIEFSSLTDDVTQKFLTELLDTRDLFNFIVKSEAPKLPTGELPDYLKVVGIVLGDSPQVVIEDSREGKTFFIQPGQGDGGFKIEKIESGKIYLSNQDAVYSIMANGQNGS